MKLQQLLSYVRRAIDDYKLISLDMIEAIKEYLKQCE